MATLKGPAVHQDREVRIGRDLLLNINIVDAETGRPYTELADKTIVWSYGIRKNTPLLTRRSTDGANAVQIMADESRVVIPILAADTIGKQPSSASLTYWHECMVQDPAGKKVNITEGKLILIEASAN
jgi:hypothetical protein